jgi:hypothetical protein
MTTLIGVDFSGAKNPSLTMWLSCGILKDNKLRITDCFPASKFEQPDRESYYNAVVDFIKINSPCIVGFDFPFSIPQYLMRKVSVDWFDFVMKFPELFPDEHMFRAWCRNNSSKELKRHTDRMTKTPFSPYNLRLFRQTYFGIKCILYPIIQKNIGTVVPLQPKDNRRPTEIIEICPACTLKNMGLYQPYKGRESNLWYHRRSILKDIDVDVPEDIKEIVLENGGGDALDSIIATKAVYNYTQRKPLWFDLTNNNELIEGRVYV